MLSINKFHFNKKFIYRTSILIGSFRLITAYTTYSTVQLTSTNNYLNLKIIYFYAEVQTKKYI